MIDSISEMKTGESPRRPKPSRSLWNEVQMPLSGIFLSYQKVPLLPYQGSTASLHFSFSLSFYFYFYFYFLFYAQHSLVWSMPRSYETQSVPGCCRDRGCIHTICMHLGAMMRCPGVYGACAYYYSRKVKCASLGQICQFEF